MLALVLALPGGDPTVAQAADAALAAPSAPAPAPVPGAPRLAARVGDVAFPDWSAAGWRAVGARDVRIAGRLARTVFYADAHGRRLGYTIVDGAALDVPDGARRRLDNTTVTVLRRGGATVATWRRGGRTCVLAARDVGAANLVALAAGRPY